jgi:phosphatidylserine/phosphatidylglycerophosphate/cardiolipin synthase-like enzyme
MLARLSAVGSAALLAATAMLSAPAPAPSVAPVVSDHVTAQATPTAGATFNNPGGTLAQQYAIADRLTSAIDAAPRGAVIRMAFYSLTIQSFAERLLAAHRRGVQVRILMDDHSINTQWDQLVAELGTDPAGGSFALLCHRSCMTDYQPSYLHAKLYMFSTSGTASRVVTVSSANPSNGQAQIGWNDAYTMVGDTTMYEAYKQYFQDLTNGALQAEQPITQPAYYWTTKSPGHKVYLFPRAGTTRDSDTVYTALSKIGCSGASRGYGTSDGHTIINVAMFQWTRYRVNLAEKLWALDNAGCRVRIVLSGQATNPEVIAALTRPGGANGGPEIRNGSRDYDGDGDQDRYVHSKYFTINGYYAGDRSSRVVFMGSHNFARNSLRYNNDILQRITKTSVFDAYQKNFAALTAYAGSAVTASGTGRLGAASLRPADQDSERLDRTAD